MKKRIYICLIIVLCVLLLLPSCGNRRGERDRNNIFFDEYVMDDFKTLESNLTKEYDLSELRTFFTGSNANESIGFGTDTSVLMFSEVNRRYPIEILRTGGYTVYRVRQGGYFYVFWVNPFSTDSNQSNNEPSVYFSAYLSSSLSSDLFDPIVPGISTAKDVKKIDPSLELSFLSSSGIFSYSYLDDETILQIEYAKQENIGGYDDLIVKEKMVVSRDSVPSRYSAILSSDLP